MKPGNAFLNLVWRLSIMYSGLGYFIHTGKAETGTSEASPGCIDGIPFSLNKGRGAAELVIAR
jgi:hypothetical protein